jgi:hypothetical protein
MKVITLALGDIDRAPVDEARTLIIMPTTDLEMATRCANLMASRAGTEGTLLILVDTEKTGFVALTNRIFKQSYSEFFGYVAQDAFPGRGWLKMAMSSLASSGAGLLAFNDGKWFGLLAGFGLVRRSWAAGLYDGDLFYSGYRQHYADAELTLIAKSDGQFCYNANSVLVEVDWDKDRKPVNRDDKALFYARAEQFFEGRVKDRRFCRIFPDKADV